MPTAQWWFDCQAASRKNKKKGGSRSSSLVKDDSHSVFIGNGDSNDMDYMSDSTQTTTSASLDAHIVKVGKDDKEWRMHGRPDRDETTALESGAASLSSISCKTNPILMLSILFISISKYVFYGSASGERP